MKGTDGVMCVGWRNVNDERRVLKLREMLSERREPHNVVVSVGVHIVWLRGVDEEESAVDDGRAEIGDVVSI